MDDPRPQLQAALKEAMKNQNVTRRRVLRLVMSAIKQVEVDERHELSGQEVIAVLQKEARRFRESIVEYQKGRRDDLVQQTRSELAVVEEFLPQPLSAEQIAAIVREVIAETGTASAKDIGKVMKPVMERVKGLADGKLVNQIVREQLS